MTAERPRTPAPGLAALGLAALVLAAVLVLPDRPDAWARMAVPMELPVILAGLVAMPARWRLTGPVRAGLVAPLVAIVLLKLADVATYLAYGRSFNPVLDLPLVDAAWQLASGTLGAMPAALFAGAVVAAAVTLAVALWWATGVWAAVSWHGRWRAAPAAVALLAAGFVGAGWGQASTARLGYERVTSFGRSAVDLREFQLAARGDDRFRDAPGLLGRLAGRDVLIVFVESYGRASLENPLYAPTHTATLRATERRLGEAGLAARSAWLTAPMRGGQSWLAHASVASGLWVSDQGRYRAALASERRTLYHLARDAGYQTVAVAPAITKAWPEAAAMGFETVLEATDLGYRGEPFNWVTMPDQFTLSALERRLLGRPGDDPLFAEVALISSHAPWVPIPPVIDWEDVGDGRVFDRWATSGDPPEVVWRDRDRVRLQYRKAIDYSIRVLGEFALRHADDPPLLVILGDHQPARFVSQSDSFDVPVHIIGPPALIADLDGWGWSYGLVPETQAPAWRMDVFRDRFLDAFSDARTAGYAP